MKTTAVSRPREPVSEGAGDAFDEPVEAEATKVVAHLVGVHLLGPASCRLGDERAQLGVGEAVGVQPELQDAAKQSLHAGITEPQGRDQ